MRVAACAFSTHMPEISLTQFRAPSELFGDRQYVWVGRLDPQGELPAVDVEGSIAMFALENRSKPLIVVSESHPILEE